MAVLSDQKFKRAIIDYMEYKDLNELSHLMKSCDFIITDTGQFTYNIWNQTQIHLDIRVPLPLMKRVEDQWQKIIDLCEEVYPEDRNHALTKIERGIKFLEEDEVIDESEENNELNMNSTYSGQVFDNLVAKVHKIHIDSIEKDYILEACYCGKNGYRLAAATMIGCAAERLLFQLCESYLAYLNNNTYSEKVIRKFEESVLHARKAHSRLDGFIRTVRNQEALFKLVGLENSNLHFSFLDIIRQVRNESGHPTGVKISNEDLSTIFGNYQLLIERVHPIIIRLSTYQK